MASTDVCFDLLKQYRLHFFCKIQSIKLVESAAAVCVHYEKKTGYARN